MSDEPAVSASAVIADLQARVRDRVRAELLRHGASSELEDASVYAEVDRLIRGATERAGPRALVLPELLGDPDGWQLDPSIHYASHRGAAGGLIVAVKRRVLMPLFKFLFEYSRDNFERQQRVNLVLFACVQELAIENALLRREMTGGARGAASDRDTRAISKSIV